MLFICLLHHILLQSISSLERWISESGNIFKNVLILQTDLETGLPVVLGRFGGIF